MRIISGFAKGRKLHGPQNDKVIRPTSDRAKEALFSILGKRVEAANVIDLFAGSGAFGIEALSRGAQSATFIDNGRESLKLLDKNINILLHSLPKVADAPFIDVIKADVLKFNLHSDRLHVPLQSIDILFMDPPYSRGYVEKIISKLDQDADLKTNCLLIAEERASETPPQNFTHFTLMDERRYGDTVFWFYQFTNTPICERG